VTARRRWSEKLRTRGEVQQPGNVFWFWYGYSLNDCLALLCAIYLCWWIGTLYPCHPCHPCHQTFTLFDWSRPTYCVMYEVTIDDFVCITGCIVLFDTLNLWLHFINVINPHQSFGSGFHRLTFSFLWVPAHCIRSFRRNMLICQAFTQ
jgi:hypothetical protein